MKAFRDRRDPRRNMGTLPVLHRLEQALSFAPRPRPADASVLLALTDELEPKILLTRRSIRLNSHAGEVSFPGGKRDLADTSNIVVALREAQEETGLDPFSVRLIGELPSQRARNGLSVKPIVGIIPPNPLLIAQPDEIDRLFFVKLSELMYRRPEPYRVKFNGRELQVPSFQVENEVVWGLTGRILVAMFERGLGHRIDWPLLMRQRRFGF
jgi:8-oxo-dGTP pyrophosphatase MutT (NUDIX family)